MAFKDLVKNNFILIVGLALPVLLMAGFITASTLPNLFGKPPQYDMLFASSTYQGDTYSDDMETVATTTTYATGEEPKIPVSLTLIVGKDGIMRARYARKAKNEGGEYWKKLYIYEVKTGVVRPLSLPVPDDAAKITGTREEILPATANYKLSTAQMSPDGYTLVYGSNSDTGLMGDFFGSHGRYNNSDMPRLQKGHMSTLLLPAPGNTVDYYSGPEFIGWVIGSAK